MSYYKNETQPVLEILAKVKAEKIALYDECLSFAKQFGAKPIIAHDGTRHSFYGVAFSDGNFYENADLWTTPNINLGGACWPRKKVPATLKAKSNELHKLWAARPTNEASSEPVYEMLGLDSMEMRICGGGQLFSTPMGVYVKSYVKPDPNIGTVEILGSEFESAKSFMEKREVA